MYSIGIATPRIPYDHAVLSIGLWNMGPSSSDSKVVWVNHASLTVMEAFLWLWFSVCTVKRINIKLMPINTISLP